MKKGIELEYFTVDSEGHLANAEEITDQLDFAAPEFAKCVAEIKTDPHKDLEDLKADLVNKTRKAVEKAREHGLRLVPLGTPLNHKEVELIESERLEMMKKFNERDIEVEKELVRTGLHIHFEKKNIKDQLNILTAFDPAFALLNSSPYHKGEQIASSSRNWIYRYSWNPKFPDSVRLWPYTDSVEEWKERMHKAFEKFEEGAMNAGIDKETFRKHHHPDRSIWTPIRLRDQFPTVEYRSPDTSLPSQALKLTEDMNQILEKSQTTEVEFGQGEIADGKIQLPEFDEVEEVSRLAAKKGLESRKVKKYLEKMGFNPEEYTPLTQNIIRGENISRSEACKLRLEASKLLEKDLEEMSS